MKSVGEWVLLDLVEEPREEVAVVASTAGNDPVAQEALVLDDYMAPGIVLQRGDHVLVTLIGSAVQIYRGGKVLYAVNRYNIVAKLEEKDGSGAAS